MLTYFPTPYPNELWYSVLCRYYVRSGCVKQLTIADELYQGHFVGHGRLFPGTSCATVLGALPDGLLDVKELLLNHTLMPYYLRIHNLDRKRLYLERVSAGSNESPKNTNPACPDGRQGLKYCPECYREDQERFGEAYWHREHQIPLIPLCPVHHCRLEIEEHPWQDINRRFYPASEMTTIRRSNYQSESWEVSLSDVLYDFLTLLFEIGPTDGYSNLNDILIANGYSTKAYHGKLSVNGQKLYDGCAKLFSREIMAYYFPKPYSSVSHRIQKWMFSAPEVYALLSVLAGITAKDLFGPRILSEKERTTEMRTEPIALLFTKSERLVVEAAAQRSSQPLSVYARERLLKAIHEDENNT